MPRRAGGRSVGGVSTFVLRVVIATVLLAGCGGSASDDVRSAWQAAASAAADGDGTAFCAAVTAEGRKTVTSRTGLACDDAVRLLAATLSAADKTAIRSASITKVEVDGERATVIYDVDASLAKVGFTGHTSLERVDGRWMLRGV